MEREYSIILVTEVRYDTGHSTTVPESQPAAGIEENCLNKRGSFDTKPLSVGVVATLLTS